MSAARRSTATTDPDDERLSLDVLVLGGGIGGLAAALSFARRGARVRVIEQAPVIAEVGAGLQVTPNGARVLRALGVWPEAEVAGLHARALEPHDALTGRRIARFDLSFFGGGWLFLHRADLQGVLLRSACDAGVEVRIGLRGAAVLPNGLAFDSGERLDADLIVGADGLHSVVRRHVVGPNQPFFTGQVAWRALVEASQEAVARVWMAPGRHVVTYPLRDGRLNLVAVREEAAWAEEGWSHRDDPHSFRRAFDDVAPELAELMTRVTEVGRWGLFRHPVPENWHRQGAVLLGDAAHPTLPFLAQGANLALEDAWVLAREVARAGPSEGLKRYQLLRRRRVVDAIAAAAANAHRFHLGGLRRRLAHQGLSAVGSFAPTAFLGRLNWLYGFDVTREH